MIEMVEDAAKLSCYFFLGRILPTEYRVHSLLYWINNKMALSCSVCRVCGLESSSVAYIRSYMYNYGVVIQLFDSVLYGQSDVSKVYSGTTECTPQFHCV